MRMQDDWDPQKAAAGIRLNPGDERRSVQQKTFTRWMNVFLQRRNPPLEVHDLFTDIQDGRILMELLEELTGCKLLYRFRCSSHRIFRLNNISKSLSFLDDRHVKLFGIDASGVADGSAAVVLNLVWNIILHFQVKEVTGILQRHSSLSSLSSSELSASSDLSFSCSTLPCRGRNRRESSRESCRESKYHGKALKTLLLWVQRRTNKYGVEVSDFGRSWRSGLAFLALIKSINPGLVDLRESLSREPRENLQQAFITAQQSLEIPPLLEPEDVMCSSPDEQSIITYVSMFLGRHSGSDQDPPSDSEVPEIPSFKSVDPVVFGETLSDDPEAQALLRGLESSSEQQLWRRWSRRSAGSPRLNGAPELPVKTRRSRRVVQPVSPLDAGVSDRDVRLWLEKSWEQRNVSLSSEEGSCSVTALDSDEEDAYSYILDLNKEVVQPHNRPKSRVEKVEEETVEELNEESKHLEGEERFNGDECKHQEINLDKNESREEAKHRDGFDLESERKEEEEEEEEETERKKTDGCEKTQNDGVEEEICEVGDWKKGGGGGGPVGGGGKPVGGGGGKPVGGGGKPGGGGGGKPGIPGKPNQTGAGVRPGKPPSKKKYKTYPIKIDVKDLPDPPKFSPKVKDIPVSEGGDPTTLDKVVATYPAIDGDTGKPAENVKYAKGSDPDNWISIDPETAEIRLNKIPDRESPSLVNGTYIAKVLAISEDTPAKTATGTIAIKVEDVNDNCPMLTNNFQTICTTVTEINVTALDEDGDPNGPPLDFVIVPEGTQGKWQLERLNDTAAVLKAEESVWPGYYEVEFVVRDQQGIACPHPQKLKIQACVCEDGVTCNQQSAMSQTSKEVNLGSGAIGVLLLGLLLLLLIPLLMLFCQCGDTAGFPDLFAEMPFDTKTRLINYHTEHVGEKPEASLLDMPKPMKRDVLTMGMGAAKRAAAPPLAALDFHHSVNSVNEMNGGIFQEEFTSVHREGMQWMNQVDGFGFSSETEGRESHGGDEMFDLMSLPDHFLEQYYSQVTSRYDGFKVKDDLMTYDDEGKGSPAGSVGCCSLLESDDDLQFLDDLGLKFKTLAELCGGEKIVVEEVKEVLSPPPSSPISSVQTSVSSVVATQQLPPPPKLQPTIPKTEQTVVRKTTENSQLVRESAPIVREEMTTVRTGMVNQNQMLLLQQQQQQQQLLQQQQQQQLLQQQQQQQQQLQLQLQLQQQQPVYYNNIPMLQPMHYVIQPHVQNTVLLAEAPPTNMQGMVLVHNAQSPTSPGIIFQGQEMMSSGQAPGSGMVLVKNSGLHGSCANLISTGNFSDVNGGGANLIHTGNFSHAYGSCSNLMHTGNFSDLNGGGANLIHTGKFSNVKRSCPNLVQAAAFSDVYGGCANLIQTSNFFGPQPMMVVEGKVPAGSMRRGSQTSFVQGGTEQPAAISGSQKLLARMKVAKEAGRVSQKRSSVSQVSPAAKYTRSLSVGATSVV